MGLPVATVIVCTLNRAGTLRDCLASLAADGSVVEREVLVVDNGSRDETRRVVETAQASSPFTPIRYVREPRLGKSKALNRGVREARGEFLLFTDDDVIVDDGWADALVEAFGDAAIGVVGGRVKPAWPSPPPPWLDGHLARSLGVRDLGNRQQPAEPLDVIGANMGIRAAALRGLGDPFDPQLGPRGKVKVDWEEMHLVTALSLSHGLTYQPKAVVHHRIDATRMDWSYLRRTFFQRGFGRSHHDRMAGRARRPWHNRLAATLITLQRARVMRSHNSKLAAPGPADAIREFDAYYLAGYYIDELLGIAPPLVRFAASRLV